MGLNCISQNLDTSEYNVTIVSPRNFFLFTLLLPSVVVSTLARNSILQRRFSPLSSSNIWLTIEPSHSLPNTSQGSKNHCHRSQCKICRRPCSSPLHLGMSSSAL